MILRTFPRDQECSAEEKRSKRVPEATADSEAKVLKKLKTGRANSTNLQTKIVRPTKKPQQVLLEEDDELEMEEDELEDAEHQSSDYANSNDELAEPDDDAEYEISADELAAEVALCLLSSIAIQKAETVGASRKKPTAQRRSQGKYSPPSVYSDDEGDMIMPSKHTSYMSPTQLHEHDMGESSDAASSTVELSMAEFGDDSDEILKEKEKEKKQTTSRDAKYKSEQPIMAPARIEPAKKTSASKNFAQPATVDPNQNWPAETHLIYPDGARMQRTISLRVQLKVIQDVIHEAIILGSGLAMFEEAFPTSDQQLAQSLKSILTSANSLKLPLIANRVERDNIYSRHLTNYVTGRVGKMRVDIKNTAAAVVPSLYGILRVSAENGARKSFVESLLIQMNFIFPQNNITDSNTIRRNEPYLHPAIITVLHNFFFKGPKSFGKRFSETFTSSSKSSNAKEVPQAMLALVVVGIFAALKEWEGGKDERDKQEYAPASFIEISTLHTNILVNKILNAKAGSGGQKYHSLMSRLYREAQSGIGQSSRALDAQVPDIDFDGME
ncbi:hypothetical protein F5050DRAFT_1870752 [Lentinula boryana]|uniref:DUF6532 domain-containing protein n=1 Tax=Lentinula boryana TaxID=40481 RepID=A0ABQ8QJ64_9AGAR|nr:hypothetical protein F5050DRAFT_1870752 [Lentinula boryana]